MTTSKRLLHTDFPLMSELQALTSIPGVDSLCQGQTYWSPPPSALAALTTQLTTNPLLHKYCHSVFGDEKLRQALQPHPHTRICVTQGANQAFLDLVLALCDAGDKAILFRPYYFNHLMALQMNNVDPIFIQVSPSTLLPDLAYVEKALQTNENVKMVVLCNPCNPTGVVWPQQHVEQLSNLCAQYGVWLVSDEAYSRFVFEGAKHYSPQGDHVIRLHTFSKSHGMHGWRVGYIVYPSHNDTLHMHLQKVQDTVPICAAMPSQQLAYCCVTDPEAEAYVQQQIQSLEKNREILWNAIRPVFDHTLAKSQGSIYFFVPLPLDMPLSAAQERQVIEWLAKKYRVVIVPGNVFGMSGWCRISFANKTSEQLVEVAERLKLGFEALKVIKSFDEVLQ